MTEKIIEKEIDMEGLLQDVVGGLVRAFADQLFKSAEEGVKMEAHLYRLLAACCAKRAELLEGLPTAGGDALSDSRSPLHG